MLPLHLGCVFWAVSALCALTLQSQPSSDTSSSAGAFLPFGAWPFGSSLGITFLFFQYLNIIYCLFGSWQQCGFFLETTSLGWGDPSPCWGAQVGVGLCLCVYTAEESEGTPCATPGKGASLSSSSCACTGGAGRVWMSNLYSFPQTAPFAKFLFCTGDQYPRGVKLLFANFNLEIVGNSGCALLPLSLLLFFN